MRGGIEIETNKLTHTSKFIFIFICQRTRHQLVLCDNRLCLSPPPPLLYCIGATIWKWWKSEQHNTTQTVFGGKHKWASHKPPPQTMLLLFSRSKLFKLSIVSSIVFINFHFYSHFGFWFSLVVGSSLV